MKIITIKDYPKLRAVIKRAMPGYRKHKAIIYQSSEIEDQN